MLGYLEFAASVIMLAAMIFIFAKVKKKPSVVIIGICYLFVFVSVLSAGIVMTVPLPTEKVEINVENISEGGVRLYSFYSDGRVYAVVGGEDGNAVLDEIFNDDIGEKLGDSLIIEETVTLDVPIGSNRGFNFWSKYYSGNFEIVYKGKSTSHSIDKSYDDTVFFAINPTISAKIAVNIMFRLILYIVIIAVVMLLPVWYIYKHEFKSCDKLFVRIFNRGIDVFKAYKLESALCLISIGLAYFSFIYMDLNAFTAWSLESMDALIRGGFKNYLEIGQMDLWESLFGGVGWTFTIVGLCWDVWNVPLLLIHYLFNTSYEITTIMYFWSKFFVELVCLIVGILVYKIVVFLTSDKQRGLLSFVLAMGSVSVFFADGYHGQDDVFDIILLLSGLYMAVKGNMKWALFWLCLCSYDNPQMIFISVIIILSFSEGFKEVLLRVALNIFAVGLSMVSVVGLNGDVQTQYRSFLFDATLFRNGYGYVSVFALIIVWLCLYVFFIKRKKNKTENMLFSLCVYSVSFLLIAYSYINRFQAIIMLIIICILSIKNYNKMCSGLFGLLLYEYSSCAFLVSVHNNYFNFSWFAKPLFRLFGVEQLPDISLYNYLCNMHYSIPGYLTIIQGVSFAAGIWILYICHPKWNNSEDTKTTCILPLRLITTLFVSSSLIIMGAMYVIGFHIDYYKSDYSNSLTVSLTENNCIEEYYQGKKADWVQLSFKTYTGGKRYYNTQMLNIDIVDAETNEIIGSEEYNATNLPNCGICTFRIKNVDIQSGKWYIIRLSLTGYGGENAGGIQFYRTESGSSNAEKHYMLLNDNGREVCADYDVIGEVFTGRKILGRK